MAREKIGNYPGLSSDSERKILHLLIGGCVDFLVIFFGSLIGVLVSLILLPKDATFLQFYAIIVPIAILLEGSVIYWKKRIKTGRTKASKKIFDEDKKNWETAQKLRQLVTIALGNEQWGRFFVFESMKIHKSMCNVEVNILGVSYLNKFKCLFVGELTGSEVVVMFGVTEEFKHSIVSDIFHYRTCKNSDTHVENALKDIKGAVLESLDTKWPDYSEDSVDIECLELSGDIKVITSINGTEVFPAWKILEICRVLEETLS